MRKLPKQWIANVAYSVLGETFSYWVKEQIEARNVKVAEQGNLHIELDPEVYAAFQQSTAVSRKYNAILVLPNSLIQTYSEPWRRRQHAQGRLQAQTHAGSGQGRQGGSDHQGARHPDQARTHRRR
jgi:hypothetical protein